MDPMRAEGQPQVGGSDSNASPPVNNVEISKNRLLGKLVKVGSHIVGRKRTENISGRSLSGSTLITDPPGSISAKAEVRKTREPALTVFESIFDDRTGAPETTETPRPVAADRTSVSTSTENSNNLTFNLQTVKDKIGDYGETNLPNLSEKAQAALHEGCKQSKVKREKFVEEFHKRLESLPSVAHTQDENNPITNLLDLFGGDTELLDLYKEAVEEERNSTEFRDAVFAESAEKHDVNPCPGKRMVMYVGGPSAAGKSFTRKAFVEQVKEQNNPNRNTGDESYVVSIDGGIDRELCQMRQLVLQAALAKGYGGIEDLHKNTKTSVKAKVQKAAIAQGNNMHLVIPTTFIEGFHKFIMMFKKLGKSEETYQVYAEVRADKTTKNLPPEEADQSFRQTILYNGESRAYYLNGKPKHFCDSIELNKRGIECESKVYQAKYFKFGVQFSKKAKTAFKLFASKGNSLILSNESDNMHVKLDSTTKKYVQTTDNPTVRHVSRREVRLWEAVSSNPLASDDEINAILQEFGLSDEVLKSVKGKLNALPLKTQDESEVKDLKGFLKFLGENNARSQLKVTKEQLKK